MIDHKSTYISCHWRWEQSATHLLYGWIYTVTG